MSSSYRATLDEYLSRLEIIADTVIDIGGSQLELDKRLKKFDVKKCIIADLPSPHKDSKKPDLPWDMNEPIWDMADKSLIKYVGVADVVTCFEVMEYIWNPLAMFGNIEFLLRKDGIAYVSFPSFYPMHEPIEDDALRYMPAGITKLANYVGLEIISMEKRKPETNALQNFFSIERLRAAKGQDHAFMGFIVTFRKRGNATLSQYR
jgi:SAM-dependent methyltransferase